jgi:3',5'-cyclic AMP phosphodiesterase CpdA
MRLAVASDLHLEFPSSAKAYRRAWGGRHVANGDGHPRLGPYWRPWRGRVDAVLLAGDIDIHHHPPRYAELVQRFLGVPVVFILGNHEGYASDLTDQGRRFREACAELSDVFVLDDDSVVLPDPSGGAVRVVGTTLWTAFDAAGADRRPSAMVAAGERMTDFRRIRDGRHRFTPARAYERHVRASRFLADAAARHAAADDGARLVIMSHHAPTLAAVPPTRAGTLLAGAYASDLDAQIRESGAELWLHGHLHTPVDLRIGGTRVLSNPLGYPDERPGAAPIVVTV